MKRMRIVAVAMILVGISLIGTGYAFQSSYDSTQNDIDGQYVTINQGVSPSAILDYTQSYDTFVSGSTVEYTVPLDAGEIMQKLNSSAFTVKIEEKGTTGSYKLRITSALPSLFAAATKSADSWCQFMFLLNDGTYDYFGLTTLTGTTAGSEYRFYKSEATFEDPLGHNASEAVFGAGTYTVDVYLVMHEYSETQSGGVDGVPVHKANFVDAFDLSNFTIRFTVIG